MTNQLTTQNQLATFTFEQHSIRTIVINDEPWFIAKDVCDAIGLTNSRMSLLALDEDEKGVSLIYTPSGQQEMNIVSESGMYTLILRCRDAVKKGSVPHRFRKWVTAEVLPAIRKTGSYSQNASQIQPLADEQQELLSLLVRSYQFLFVAHDLREKVNPTVIGIDIEKHFSGYHLYNLGHPLRRHLDKIRNYIQDNAERLMFVQGMASLLETPTAKKAVFK